jgi:hypothetical protein
MEQAPAGPTLTMHQQVITVPVLGMTLISNRCLY